MWSNRARRRAYGPPAAWTSPSTSRPGGTTRDGVAYTYTYTANDASTADLDGDGAYELVLKWAPSNATDVADSGTCTGPTVYDAYELNGRRLWRVNLGTNVRSGSHYDSFQVYDYDGDGKAEMAVRTSDGSKDSSGTVPAFGGGASYNSAIWWDGDAHRELLDHRWSGSAGSGYGQVLKYDGDSELTRIWYDQDARSNNWTKGSPALSADLLGDWREEMLWRNADSTALRLYTTPHPTGYRLPTLMSDPVYRLGVAWQNTGYNQPPQVSYYLGTR